MEVLHGRIRPYAWGSRSFLASFTGRPVPSPGPEAELWLGTHPGDPSTVGSVCLRDIVVLPYLLKVLAAAEPLSLQAHPDAAQARAGYAAGDPSYVDPHHKPELLVALCDGFEALCGFREPSASASVLSSVDVLSDVVSILDGPGPAGPRLRAAVTTLLSWPPGSRASLVASVAGLTDLASRYPGDVGVVVSLLLNQVTLRPGEALYMPAGNLHSYLSGVGVEIMAASDNVLRGGLTPKRVDVDGLLRVLRFEVLDDPVVRPVPVSPGVVTWPVPVSDFALFRARVGPTAGARVSGMAAAGAGAAEVVAVGPRIALCTGGEVGVADDHGAVRLRRGESAFSAAERPLTVSGAGEVFVAAPGSPAAP